MVFIPVMPPPTPSPQAEELGQTLAMVIDDFLVHHPETSPLEVRQALHIAAQRSATGSNTALRVALAVGVLVMALFVGVLFAIKKRASGMPEMPMILPVVVGGLVLVGLVAVIAIRKR